jgi:hypothetical protein
MLLVALAGCGDHNEIEPGSYEARSVRGHDSAEEAEILATTLDIDRDAATATFTLQDGTELSIGFTERPRSEWPTGCPSLNTEMEVLVLDEPTLTIASFELVDPVLIASCPGDTTDVVLSEDGISSYGGVPCEERCVFFVPAGG